ncbi:MAG: chemotaxis protein CheW [Deltaproteobacteria bacterium]|nr:chemotaxis protein CheW [Deltaproteobacteria bacterium]
MKGSEFDFAKELKNLQQEFDESFSKPVKSVAGEFINGLIVNIQDDRYVVKMHEVKSIETKKEIVPLPNSHSNLLGLANLQSRIVPVYCLEMLMGYQKSKNADWLITCGDTETIALAFEEFEGQFNIPKDAIFLHEGASANLPIEGGVQIGNKKGLIIRIPVIIETIRNLHKG